MSHLVAKGLKKEPSDLYPKEKPILPDWLQNDLLRSIDTK